MLGVIRKKCVANKQEYPLMHQQCGDAGRFKEEMICILAAVPVERRGQNRSIP